MTAACRFCGSVGGEFRKGTVASVHFDARHFSSSLYSPGAFQAATLVMEPRGSKSELVSPCVCSLRGTSLGSRIFFHQLNTHWFLQPKIVGTYIPGTGTLGWGPGVGLGILAPEISLLNLYPPMWVCGQPIPAYAPLLHQPFLTMNKSL